MLSIIWTIIWLIILKFNYITLLIICSGYIVFYIEAFYIDFKVLVYISEKEYKNNIGYVLDIKEAMIKRISYSKDLFSFTYQNPKFQLYIVKFKFYGDSNITKKLYAYLTPSEVTSFLYKGIESKYEIKYYKNSKAIINISKTENSNDSNKHKNRNCNRENIVR